MDKEKKEKRDRQLKTLRMYQELVRSAKKNLYEYQEFLSKNGWEFRTFEPFEFPEGEGEEWVKIGSSVVEGWDGLFTTWGRRREK